MPPPSPPRIFGEGHGQQPGRHQGRPQVAVEAERLGGPHPLGRATPSRTPLRRLRGGRPGRETARRRGGAGSCSPFSERYSVFPEPQDREEPAMPAADLPKISADSHIDEPHDLWFERLSPDLRDRAPRRIQAEADGGWTLIIDDSPLGWSDVSAEQAAANEDARVAAAAPDVRLDMMRSDGVNAEIIYPTIGLYAWNITDPGRRARVLHGLQRLDPRTARRDGSHPPRRDDPDVGRRDGCRRGATRRGEPVGQRAAAPARRHARVEPAGVGAALVDDRGDGHPGGDAPGHRPRHDLLPGVGLAHREPARHPVDGAACRPRC